jgi:hypothetical protein
MTLRLYGSPRKRRESTTDWDIGRGQTTDRRISVHANSTGRRPRAGTTGRAQTARSAGPPTRLLRRWAGVAAVGLTVAGVAACGTAPPGDGEAASPTFSRATSAALGFEGPVANVTDLVAPTPDDGTWTIVGSVFEPDEGRSVATVWTSEDGAAWESEDVGAGSADETMTAATRTEDGIVAVGRVGGGDQADAALWTRADGEWTASSPEPLGGEHEQWAFDVAAGPGGMVVAGGENVWGEIRPRLWFSADGSDWTSVDGGPGGPLDTTGEETVRAVTPAGDGFVAVGSRLVDNEQDGMAWYSADGESWEQLDTPTLSGPGRQEVVSVTAFDGGLVAGGMSDLNGDGRGEPVVWRSADGRTWDGPNASLPMSEGKWDAARDLEVQSISFGPTGGLIAAGGNEWRPVVWQSTDGGVTWVELPDPVHGNLFQDGVALRAAASLDGVTVAIGAEPSVLLLDWPRWADVSGDAFPKSEAQPFATSVATDGEGTTIAAGGLFTASVGEQREAFAGQLWRRTGDGWEALDNANLAAGHVLDVTSFAGGFVAVGLEDFGLASKRVTVTDTNPDGLMWLSRDGNDWARFGVADARINEEMLGFIDDPSQAGLPAAIEQLEREDPPVSVAPAGGDGTRSLAAVSAYGDGFIAVGSVYYGGDAEPIILMSPDGVNVGAESPPHAGPGIQQYDDVCVDDEGNAVVVGAGGTNGAYDVFAALRKPEAWTAASGPFTGSGDQRAYACAASDEGFIMVGSDDRTGNRDARVWTSTDGLEWTEVESSILGGTGDQWASAVAPAPGGGWLVAGTDRATGDGDIALWRIDSSGDVTRRDRGERALRGPGEQTVSSIDITEDGHVTLAGNDYGRVGLWESATVDR